jgi:hypothetical protein
LTKFHRIGRLIFDMSDTYLLNNKVSVKWGQLQWLVFGPGGWCLFAALHCQPTRLNSNTANKF